MIGSQQIREHMEIVSKDGKHVGTVDHMEGSDHIKVTKADSPDEKHHFFPLDWVDRVDDRVYLKKTSQEFASNLN